VHPKWELAEEELTCCHAVCLTMLGYAVTCCAPGAALKIFEALEMWDQLIVCYRLLDKKQVAQELVLARLQVGVHVFVSATVSAHWNACLCNLVTSCPSRHANVCLT
jgi:hypothetical protein